MRSLLTLSCVAATAILFLLFDEKSNAGQCLRPGARPRILQEMNIIQGQIDGVERIVYKLKNNLNEAERVASRTYLSSQESTAIVMLAKLVTIPKLKQEIQYGQNLINQSWQRYNVYNDYLKLPDCNQPVRKPKPKPKPNPPLDCPGGVILDNVGCRQ